MLVNAQVCHSNRFCTAWFCDFCAAFFSSQSALRCIFAERAWHRCLCLAAPRAFVDNARCSTACNKAIPEMTQSRKRTPSKGRARHARRRLKQLLRTIPDLPADVLEHCSLRQLSFSVRRCRGGPQSVLRGVAEIRADSSLPLVALSSLDESSPTRPFGE